MQHDDQRILAGEKHVHIADDAIVRYEQQTEPQERSVLQQDVQHDTPHVNGTATRTAARADNVPATHVSAPRERIVSEDRSCLKFSVSQLPVSYSAFQTDSNICFLTWPSRCVCS